MCFNACLMFSKVSPRLTLSPCIQSCPVQLVSAGGWTPDRIGFDPFVLDELVFLLSLFNCGRFSRHGLSISGFSVSGQAVSSSSLHGWFVFEGWGISLEDIYHIHHDLAFAVMEAVSNDDEWHILGFLRTKGYHNNAFFVVLEKVLFLREKPFLCGVHTPDDKSPVSVF